MSLKFKIILLISLISLVITGFLTLTFVNLSHKIKQTMNSIQGEEKIIGNLNLQLEKYADSPNRKEVIKYYQYLPSHEGIPEILSYIDKTAANNEMEIVSIAFDSNFEGKKQMENNPPKGSQYETLMINLKLITYKQHIQDFMDDIYHAERLINIDLGEWSVSQSNNGFSELKLTLRAYYYPKINDAIPVQSSESTL